MVSKCIIVVGIRGRKMYFIRTEFETLKHRPPVAEFVLSFIIALELIGWDEFLSKK